MLNVVWPSIAMQPVVVVGDDRVAHPAVGGEQDRADRALALGAEDDGAGAVAEQRGGALVGGVDDAARAISAPITSTRVGAAGLDLGGADRERGRASRCRRRRRRYAPTPMPSASATSGAVFGRELVGRHRRHEDEVDVGGRRPASESARRAAASARSRGALARGGVAALADAGAADDPVRVDADRARRSGRWGRRGRAAGGRARGRGRCVPGRARPLTGAVSDEADSGMVGTAAGTSSTFVPGTIRLASRASTLPGPTSTKRPRGRPRAAR